MKKWYEYQVANIISDHDWAHSYEPIANINDEFCDDFTSLKNTYYQWCAESNPNLVTESCLVGSENYAKYIQDVYDDPYIQANIIEWCRDPEYARLIDGPSVDRMNLKSHFPEFSARLCDRLRVTDDYGLVFCQVQRPGYISPLHVDSRKTIEHQPGKKIKPWTPPDHSRWIIFMEDWKPGQAFEMGHQYIKWRQGDVFYWSTRDVPHALANMGYWDRFLIIVYARPIDQQ